MGLDCCNPQMSDKTFDIDHKGVLESRNAQKEKEKSAIPNRDFTDAKETISTTDITNELKKSTSFTDRPSQLSLSCNREDAQKRSIEEMKEGSSPYLKKEMPYRTQSNPIYQMKSKLNDQVAFMRTTSFLTSKSNTSASSISNVEDFKAK